MCITSGETIFTPLRAEVAQLSSASGKVTAANADNGLTGAGANHQGVVAVIAAALVLFYEHRLVRPDDLSKLNAAFFTTNAFVSVILFVTFGGSALLRNL